METRVKRTLVKSAPELWELIDDPELMRRWHVTIGGDVAAGSAVTALESGRRLASASAGDSPATIDIWLHGKGFGTNVTIVARAEREIDADILESLLDELASPQRRPFAHT